MVKRKTIAGVEVAERHHARDVDTRRRKHILNGSNINSLNPSASTLDVTTQASSFASGVSGQAIVGIQTELTFVHNEVKSILAKYKFKGDMVVQSGTGHIARLLVGANNTVLTADSAQTLGVKWSSIGTGSLADGSVTNAKLADMAAATVKGRASGAGTGVPTDLSASQLNTIVGTVDLTMADTKFVAADIVQARDASGLSLKDDGGNVGVFIEDGGQVGINTVTPGYPLEVNGDVYLAANRLLLQYGTSTPASGAAIRWGPTGNTNVLGMYVSGGINFQGNASNPSFRVTVPTTDGTIGATSFEVNGSTGAMNVTGTARVGDGTTGASVTIDGAAATSRDILYRTAGTNRWIVRCDGTAETGSNVGSNFVIGSRQDDGTSLATPLTITRSNSNIGIRQATPQANLHVGGGADAPTAANVTIYASNAGATAIAARDSTNDIEVKMGAGTTLAFMGSVTNQALQIMTNNAEVARYDTSGNYGVGVTPNGNAKVQVNGGIAIVDGMTAPSTITGYAQIYVDTADGDLKVKFGDGTVKTIVVDT